MTTPLLQFMNLFPEFRTSSWDAWRAILARLTPDVREFFAAVGRGAGKSRIVSLLAAYYGTRPYPLAPGERVFIGVFAPDRKQAGITFRYVVGLFRSVPALEALIVGETRESLTLSTGVTIEVLSATIAAPRGRAYALAIVEEAAFLPTDASANPDQELLRALRPALARVPGSLLAVVSSPYARRGVLWQAWQRYHGQPAGAVLFVQAATLALNPTFDAGAIERAYEEDPVSAAAEYGAQFRSDVETFIDREVIEAAVVPGRREVPPCVGPAYYAFLDFAGGSGGDSATCAIAHVEVRGQRAVAVLDAVREVRPPFSPASVCDDFARLVRDYGLYTATADRFAGEFPVEQMQQRDVSVRPSARSKSDIYAEFLPRVNSRTVELLDVPRLVAQLAALERHTARGGKDSIDHPPGGHDDVANAAAGAVVQAFQFAPWIGASGSGHVVSGSTRDRDTRRARVQAREATGAQEALDRFHDDRSPMGNVRRVFRSVHDEEDSGEGKVHMDWDVFADNDPE